MGWRRERDSNPRNLSAQLFSRQPHSATLPSLQNFLDLETLSTNASGYFYDRLIEQIAIQAPVLDRFEEMSGLDRFTLSEVGDRSRHF